MSDQGPLPDRRDDFGLIETLLWTRGRRLRPFARTSRAAARVERGARLSPMTKAKVAEALLAAVPTDATSPARLRVRLVLCARRRPRHQRHADRRRFRPRRSGASPLAEARFSSDDPLLRHKTTRRALYEDELARATQALRAPTKFSSSTSAANSAKARAAICSSRRATFCSRRRSPADSSRARFAQPHCAGPRARSSVAADRICRGHSSSAIPCADWCRRACPADRRAISCRRRRSDGR